MIKEKIGGKFQKWGMWIEWRDFGRTDVQTLKKDENEMG